MFSEGGITLTLDFPLLGVSLAGVEVAIGLLGVASLVGGVFTRGGLLLGVASLVGGVFTRGGLLFSCCGVFLVGVSSHWLHEVLKSLPSL